MPKKVTNNKKIYFTTSWDDGSVHDLRLVELLNKYRIKGTFYVPQNFNRQDDKFSEYGRRLNEEEIKLISESQEIGAHSLNHVDFKNLPEEKLREEISGTKLFIEKITGKEVKMFCPPNGVVNKFIIDTTEGVGYKGLRTTSKLEFRLPEDAFNMNVSVQCAPFPFRKKDCRSFYWRKLFGPIVNYKILYFPSLWLSIFSWESFADSFFNYALNHGNYFHLYGHSWEIEKYCMWEKLEVFLKKASRVEGIKFLTNSEILVEINK